jgi:hypothetical protein
MAEAKTVTLVFLPVQFTDWSRAIELLKGGEDVVYLAHRDTFDAFKAAVHRTRKDLEIFSYPTAIAEMAKRIVDVLDCEATEEAEEAV